MGKINNKTAAFNILKILIIIISIFFGVNNLFASENYPLSNSIYYCVKEIKGDSNIIQIRIDTVKLPPVDTTKVHIQDTVKFHALDTIKPKPIDSIRIGKIDTVHVLRRDSSKVNLNLNQNIRRKKTIGENVEDDFNIFFKDWGQYLTYPFRMSGTDWLIGAGAIGGTVLSSLADKKMKQRFGIRYGDFNHEIWDFPSGFGYIYYQMPVIGAAYLTGLFIRNDEIRTTARLLMQSLAYSGTIVIGLRYVFDRVRPAITDDPYKFNWFKIKSLDTQSFPSGHTAVAWATCTILAERIGTWWSRVLLYSFAGVCGWSKIRNNRHWLSDVVFGSMIGFSSSWFVVHEEAKREKKNKKGGGRGGGEFSFYPSFNGFSIVYNFK